MKKKAFLVVLVVLMACSPIFAATTIKSGTTSLDLSFVIRFVKMAIIIAGILLLVKATSDIIHAVRNADQDPNGIKKVISNTLLYAIVLGGFYVLISVIFKDKADSTSETIDVSSLASADAGAGFIQGLTGALVQL